MLDYVFHIFHISMFMYLYYLSGVEVQHVFIFWATFVNIANTDCCNYFSALHDFNVAQRLESCGIVQA